MKMRCAICLQRNPAAGARCVECGAGLDEEAHREMFSISYLLRQVTTWESGKRMDPETLQGLRREYSSARETLRESLREPTPPAVHVEPPPLPPVVKEEIIIPKPKPPAPVCKISKPVIPKPSPKPVVVKPSEPAPPFEWKNLLTEQNIRWILNLGIFIFSIALAVFIQTQWRGMGAGLKISILFTSTFAAMAAGHFMQKTILKFTGVALVMLGSIAVPIDCLAILQFGLVDPAHGDTVGLVGALFCLLLYTGLARLYPERLFHALATLAATFAWGFLLRQLDLGWSQIVPWIAPFVLVGGVVRSDMVRLVSRILLGGSVVMSLVFLAPGVLEARRDGLAIEIALASALATFCLVRRRRKAEWPTWGAMGILVAMFLVGAEYAGLSVREYSLAWTLLGTAFAAGWIWSSRPFMLASILACLLGVMVGGLDAGRLTFALLLPGTLHAIYAFTWKKNHHAFAGWLLIGLALVAFLESIHIPGMSQPLAFAAFGVGMTLMSRRLCAPAFHLLAALSAGGAMFVLSLWWMQYFKFGDNQFLGASIAILSALAFGPVANAQRSRFVSDITYACLVFAWLLVLKGFGMETKWLGLSLVVFAVGYVLLERRISRWLLRPTFFTGVACTLGAAVFATLQVFVFFEYAPASLTLLLIGGFYLAISRVKPYQPLAHVGIYVAAAGVLTVLKFLLVNAPTFSPAWLRLLAIPVEGWTLVLLTLALAALLVASWRRHLHAALAGLVVVLLSLTFSLGNPMMYQSGNLWILVAATLLTAMTSGVFAFDRLKIEPLDLRVLSGLMGGFGALSYMLTLKALSTGSPWGGLVIFAMAGVLCGTGGWLFRRGWKQQGLPLAMVAVVVAVVAVLRGHTHGALLGVHLWIYLFSLGLFTVMAHRLKQEAFTWVGLVFGGCGLVSWLFFWEATPWIGVWTFPLVLLAMQQKERGLMVLGLMALVLCPLHAAWFLREAPPFPISPAHPSWPAVSACTATLGTATS